MLLAGLLMTPLAVDGLCLGSFHLLMVWLMVAGLCRGLRGQSWSGGILLGFAAWLKLLPLLGVEYLLVRRRWVAACIAWAVRWSWKSCCQSLASASKEPGRSTSTGGTGKRPA